MFADNENLNPDFLTLNAMILNAEHDMRECIYMSVLENPPAMSASKKYSLAFPDTRGENRRTN